MRKTGETLAAAAALAAVLACAAPFAADAADGDGFDGAFEEAIDPWYAGGGTAAALPGAGCKTRPCAAAEVFLGTQLNDSWAIELSGLCAPNSTSPARSGDCVLWGAGARALWYFGTDLIGYERFAPCLSLGAEAFGSRGGDFPGAHRAAGGPSAGLHFYWHADDNWSFRAGARMAFLADSKVETVSVAGISAVFSWGGADADDGSWRADGGR